MKVTSTRIFVFGGKWEAAGNSLYIANRVPIGHLELQVLWPGMTCG
jgi:hypothetical protein